MSQASCLSHQSGPCRQHENSPVRRTGQEPRGRVMKTGGEVRAFIAIELPESVKSFLVKISAELKLCGGPVKWVRPEGIHLTLKFLGSVPSDLLPRIQEAALPLFREQKPTQLHVSGLGAFPHLRRPRVIWAGLEDPAGVLSPLVNSLETVTGTAWISKGKETIQPAPYAWTIQIQREKLGTHRGHQAKNGYCWTLFCRRSCNTLRERFEAFRRRIFPAISL